MVWPIIVSTSLVVIVTVLFPFVGSVVVRTGVAELEIDVLPSLDAFGAR
jgi:hypothetical protein